MQVCYFESYLVVPTELAIRSLREIKTLKEGTTKQASKSGRNAKLFPNVEHLHEVLVQL